MTVARLVFKSLYPFCCATTKMILGNMDAKTEEIQRCVNQELSGELGWVHQRGRESFGKWLDILEKGTFNLVERIAIKAALHDYKQEATRKLIYSTLVGGEAVRPQDYDRLLTAGYTPAEVSESLKDLGSFRI
jgi:hypothetical protein